MNVFGQPQSSAQQPSQGPNKNAPKKGGRGRPKKQANAEEDHTHVDMMDYHGSARTRHFPLPGSHAQHPQAPVPPPGSHVQQPHAPVGQPGSTQVPGYQQWPQASSTGTPREEGSKGAAPAAYPLSANGSSQEFNGQAHRLRQPPPFGGQGINGPHRGTQWKPVANGPMAFHQGQYKVENTANPAHLSSANDRKRPREVYEDKPDTARQTKKACTTSNVSNLNNRGKSEIPQQKQESTEGPNQVHHSDEDEPTVQVCIGKLDPRAVGVALNKALDALRTGQPLLKARTGDDALCVPPNSHIVCLPPNGPIAYYGPSNTIATGKRWQEMPATSYSAGWFAASQHNSLAMAGVPVQDIRVEVFDSRKHHLTALLADATPETVSLNDKARISADSLRDSSRGPQRSDMEGESDGDHTGDALDHRSLFSDVQQDDVLPSTALPASCAEKSVLPDFILDSQQASTHPAGSPSAEFVNQQGLASTRTELANAGATPSILDRIINDPTIPNLEDLNAAGDKPNLSYNPESNSGEVVCLDAQDAGHHGEPLIPAPTGKSDDAVPPKSPQDTPKPPHAENDHVTRALSGSAITTRELMQAPVMSSNETASPSTANSELAQAETSKETTDASQITHAAPVVVSERRKQWYREQAQAEKERLEQGGGEAEWDALQNEHFSGKPDDNVEPESAPADVSERQSSVSPNEADDTNGGGDMTIEDLLEAEYI